MHGASQLHGVSRILAVAFASLAKDIYLQLGRQEDLEIYFRPTIQLWNDNKRLQVLQTHVEFRCFYFSHDCSNYSTMLLKAQ